MSEDDIVERLRDGVKWSGVDIDGRPHLHAEAADEIERLRAALVELRTGPSADISEAVTLTETCRRRPATPTEVGAEPNPPAPPADPETTLAQLLDEGMTWGDAASWLPALPEESVDLFFTSPPYANARSYSEIHPDDYVEWFTPHAEAMLAATTDTGWLVLNIKNRVASGGPLKGQRHPYVYELVLALQQMGWRWIETYIWHRPNAIPGKFGPRTKDSFEYVYAFAKGKKPMWDLDSIRVPYKADEAEIARRKKDTNGRRNTDAGFGRDRTKTYLHGGADPGNVVSVAQTYNQHYGPAGQHTAVMPEGLASFFVKAASPSGGVVIDPFAGSATTVVIARRNDRRAGGLDLHEEYVDVGRARIEANAGASRSGATAATTPAAADSRSHARRSGQEALRHE